MHEIFDRDSIPEIRDLAKQVPRRESYQTNVKLANGRMVSAMTENVKKLAGARDFLRLLDIPGLVQAAKENGFKSMAQDVEKGDDLAAQQIEKMVNKIEAGCLITTGVHFGDDVVGAVPNIGAYLSGSPMNMRNKRREKNNRGPLSLFLETTTSAGFDGPDKITRMAAMVVLARAIAVRRPLNLWLNVTYGGEGKLLQSSIQFETNPIDLTRLAAICSHLGDINHLGRSLSLQGPSKKFMEEKHYSWGSWAYGIPELERTYAGEILGRVISPGSQIAYLPAGLLGVDDISNPQAWMERMLKKYAPYMLDGVDRDDEDTSQWVA